MKMAKSLTGSEGQEILHDRRHRGIASDSIEGTEHCFELSPQLGKGYWIENQLCPGLVLTLTDLEKEQDRVYHIYQHSRQLPLTASFHLKGSCRVTNDGLKYSQQELAGKNCLYQVPSTAEKEEFQAYDRLSRIHIQISLKLLDALGINQMGNLPVDLEQAIAGDSSSIFYRVGKTTPIMWSILKQLIQCP